MFYIVVLAAGVPEL